VDHGRLGKHQIDGAANITLSPDQAERLQSQAVADLLKILIQLIGRVRHGQVTARRFYQIQAAGACDLNSAPDARHIFKSINGD
jgi:hypothetical protein